MWGAFSMIPCRTGPTLRSLDVYPASSALVESDMSRCTPVPLASSARPCRSVGRPSSGVWSILKSPVCRMEPNGVSTATAMPSGIECVTRRNRIVNGPVVAPFPGTAVISSHRSATPCSSSLPRSSASVNGVP